MFSWIFQSKKEKSATWYLGAIVLALALIAWGIFMGIYILAVVVFIFVGVYMLIENNAPDTVQVEVNENGILVAENFYDYAKIESFGIIYNGSAPYILRIKLRSKGFRLLDLYMRPDIINTAELRAYLVSFLQEDEKSELSTSERLLQYF